MKRVIRSAAASPNTQESSGTSSAYRVLVHCNLATLAPLLYDLSASPLIELSFIGQRTHQVDEL